MSKFYILSEDEIYNMHGYADQREWDEPEIFRKEVLNPVYEVEFDGDLREFVTEKINQKSYEHLTWAMLDHMLGTLRIIFEEERPMSLTDYEVLKGNIHAVKLVINKEKCLKEEESK